GTWQGGRRIEWAPRNGRDGCAAERALGDDAQSSRRGEPPAIRACVRGYSSARKISLIKDAECFDWSNSSSPQRCCSCSYLLRPASATARHSPNEVGHSVSR